MVGIGSGVQQCEGRVVVAVDVGIVQRRQTGLHSNVSQSVGQLLHATYTLSDVHWRPKLEETLARLCVASAGAVVKRRAARLLNTHIHTHTYI